MGLIPSHRHTPADVEAWERLAVYDRLLATDPRLDRAADRARQVIEEFATAGPCYVGVSWGKDSVVIAHLLATSNAATTTTLIFARAKHWETPEVDQVRDAFLATYPHVQYEEREYEFRVPLRGEPGFDTTTDTQDALWEVFCGVCGGRRITGVRAEESKTRAMSLRIHGESTDRSCRPIIKWDCARDVFPYLTKHDLPVHPAYGMTVGGYHDRRWLRVHALGCELRGISTAHGADPWSWEDRYYGDVMAAARVARAKP